MALPERSALLRDEYSAIKPGWHMNKLHWNTVELEDTLSSDLIRELIDHSYDLVVAGLTKVKKRELELL